MSLTLCNAFLFAFAAKRQLWVYEPIEEQESASKYWDAPIGMALVDGYMSHIISEEPGSTAPVVKEPKRRPL